MYLTSPSGDTAHDIQEQCKSLVVGEARAKRTLARDGYRRSSIACERACAVVANCPSPRRGNARWVRGRRGNDLGRDTFITRRRLEDPMDYFQKSRVKWPYVTHLVDRRCVQQVLPIEDGRDVGALVLARVTKLGRHGDLEAPRGRRLTLFAGDVFVGALGDRYATAQFEGAAVIAGGAGHIVSIGGVVGQVASMNASSLPPTTIEFLGRLADEEGRPLHMRQFQVLAPE